MRTSSWRLGVFADWYVPCDEVKMAKEARRGFEKVGWSVLWDLYGGESNLTSDFRVRPSLPPSYCATNSKIPLKLTEANDIVARNSNMATVLAVGVGVAAAAFFVRLPPPPHHHPELPS